MRVSGKLRVIAILLSWALGLAIACVSAQVRPAIQQLFQQLQSKQTSDHAYFQLVELTGIDAPAHARALHYLALHLPALIEVDPRDPKQRTLISLQWCNAVKLAGELKIVEAAPGLAKWISISTEPGLWVGALIGRPAGLALVQIGDPSVPVLQKLLADGNKDERWNAVYALNEIQTSKAVKVLRDYEARGQDYQLREFVHNILEVEAHNKEVETKKPNDPHSPAHQFVELGQVANYVRYTGRPQYWAVH